ncbi:conserved protein of unknown function [Nitrospira japonica]|uniref:Delta(24)-sterol reductase n=1 Tax=Nitrospira japonica TaxID=1325564 RepID=A0A1W1I4D4_9BACT|nr:FAD-binding oxidoreductase [Nitrospira japonica]SLM47864.1 conserved protein of unknown function [Nitrospira japonica]
MIPFDAYAEKRARAAASMQSLGSEGLSLEKSTSNLFRHRTGSAKPRLDLREFRHVIRIDEQARTAEVEALTTYEELVRETLPFQLMPAVVPQLKSITVGGAIAGIGIESSSFRYGFVHETMRELDVLLSDGRVVTATADNDHRDLFFGFPNSYGTLGYALRTVIDLIPIKPFVKLTHRRFTDPDRYFEAMADACRQGGADFVDGTMFDGRTFYLTTGIFVGQAEWLSDYTYLQMYYRSITEKTTDYLITHDYLWRWDTDWFWCSKHFLLQYPIMRRLWGKERLNSGVYWRLWKRAHGSRVAQLALKMIEGRQEAVIQDVEIPIEQAPRFARFFNERIGITPVWLCPVAVRDPARSYSLYPMEPGMPYVNFGFWDTVKSRHGDGHFNKLVEETVRDLRGHKSLYSTSYYSREEFDRLYNGEAYRRLKGLYDPGKRLKGLYEKCVLKL